MGPNHPIHNLVSTYLGLPTQKIARKQQHLVALIGYELNGGLLMTAFEQSMIIACFTTVMPRHDCGNKNNVAELQFVKMT